MAGRMKRRKEVRKRKGRRGGTDAVARSRSRDRRSRREHLCDPPRRHVQEVDAKPAELGRGEEVDEGRRDGACAGFWAEDEARRPRVGFKHDPRGPDCRAAGPPAPSEKEKESRTHPRRRAVRRSETTSRSSSRRGGGKCGETESRAEAECGGEARKSAGKGPFACGGGMKLNYTLEHVRTRRRARHHV